MSKSESEIIYGLHPVIEAIKSGRELDRVFLKAGIKGRSANDLAGLLKQFGIPYQWVPEERLNRFTRKNHQGVVALVALVEFKNIEEIIPMLYEAGRIPYLIVLDGVTDVRNFGAIARTAECMGADALIIPESGSARINADAIKTSAGALNHISVCRVKNMKETIVFLKNSGIRIFAANEKASESFLKADFSHPSALVLGAEDRGISPVLLKLSDNQINIPLSGSLNSLNVSVASGIIMYEMVRQRKGI